MRRVARKYRRMQRIASANPVQVPAVDTATAGYRFSTDPGDAATSL
jgi:hypothetical protein